MKTIIALLLFTTTALAVEPTSIQTMPEYACKQDAVRFCKNTLQTESPFTILACLSAHKKSLTKDCKAILIKYGQ